MTKFETEVKNALIDLVNAVEKIELVCEDLIDCNDDLLMETRRLLDAAKKSINELECINELVEYRGTTSSWRSVCQEYVDYVRRNVDKFGESQEETKR